MVYVYVYALRLKMKDVGKRKSSRVVKREKRGRGRYEGLGLVQTQRWEQFNCRDGRGGRRQFVWARYVTRPGPLQRARMVETGAVSLTARTSRINNG